jgi:hypothetical protein
MMNGSKPMSEADMQAHMDGTTLIEAQKIKGDPKRHKPAMEHVKKIQQDAKKHLDAISQLTQGNYFANQKKSSMDKKA